MKRRTEKMLLCLLVAIALSLILVATMPLFLRDVRYVLEWFRR